MMPAPGPGGGSGGFEGMDVGSVTLILTQMHNLESQLTSVITGMNQQISALESAWQGPDARQMAGQWPEHQASLHQASHAVQDVITHVQAHLNAQEQVSSSY